MNYFELSLDGELYEDMWHLEEPRDSNGQKIEGQLLPRVGPCINADIAKIQVSTRYSGIPIDFTFGYGFLLLRKWVAEIIQRHGGKIQRIPVVIEPATDEEYEVVFTLTAPIGLVDISRSSEYEFYAEDDQEYTLPYGGIAPRQKNMLYKAYPLHIFADKAKGHEFFRPWEYTSALIISEALKNDFEKAGVTGIKYTLVS